MRHTILLFVFIGISLCVVAQQKKMDSLETLLTNHKELDTIQLNLLHTLAKNYSDIDPKKGLEYANRQLALATTLNLKDKISEAFINKANNYLTMSQDSLALKCFYTAYDIDVSINDSDGQGVTLYGIASIYQNRGDYHNAIEHYQKSYKIFESLNSHTKMAAVLNAIGICQMYLSDYQRALETYLKSLKIYEINEMSESTEAAICLGNIGLIYNRMGKNLKLGIQYHERALKIHKANGNKFNEANTISNMANAYDDLKQPEKAIELQQQAYILFEEVGSKRGMANALTNIGIAYTKIDYNKTLEHLKRTLPIYEEIDDKYGQTIVLQYLGEALLNLPETKNNLLESENYLRRGIAISRDAGYLQAESDMNNLFAELYTKKKDYKNAYSYKIEAVKLHDSIMSQENLEQITRLEEQYKYEKKEADIKIQYEKEQALAQAEIERQKLIKTGYVLGGSLLLVFIGIGVFFYKRRRDAIDKQHEAEYKATVAETELKALRAQMNPHFIFNSLNSIGDYISKNDTSKAKTYLSKFAKIMRQTLEHSNENEISLEEDLNLLENYMQMENQRLGGKLTYSINVDQHIDKEAVLVPPMILQPFVENSIWHGISKKEGSGSISITIKKENNMLLCIVEDDGSGIQEDENTLMNQKKSLGQNITQKRIEIINKNKNTKGNVTVQNKANGQGVKVEVRLPLEMAF
ncbi:MAG: tetratricopeptide repeat protein [Flavobacteriaceae bacterium]|nr:tetratricopeptide repeat protein [Flavobacteriaceae bacterium]